MVQPENRLVEQLIVCVIANAKFNRRQIFRGGNLKFAPTQFCVLSPCRCVQNFRPISEEIKNRTSIFEIAIAPRRNAMRARYKDRSEKSTNEVGMITPLHFDASAEVSVRHFGSSAEPSGHIGTSATLRHSGRQFGTGQHWTKPWQGGRLCLRNYVN